MFESEGTGAATTTIVPAGDAAAQLATMPPGSELAYLVEQVDLAGADDHALVETVAALQRLAGWVAAAMAHAAAALAARPSMNPAWPASAGKVSEPNVAGDELAMRLGCSRRQARLLVRDGRAYEGALAWTGQALARGEIDPVKARIIVNALIDRPVPLALDVQDAVLPGAPGRTPTQLAKDVARQIITQDPDGAAEHHRCAMQRRRVDHPKVLPDGMAGLWAVLPATGAVRLDTTLDTLARGARAAGDDRTLDQLRADLLVDLTTGEVEGSAAWAALTPQHSTAPPTGEDRCTASGAVAPVGTDTSGGRVPTGENPSDADADADASDTASLAGTTPCPGAAPLADTACHAGTAARNADTIHATAAPVHEPEPSGTFRGTARRTEIRVTVPLSTLLGLDDHPADLSGYGPITASAARALSLGGTWRRIVTDPLSGRVLDVGRTRYRPPTDLATHIQARDRTCVRPGCPTPAESCDLDHTVEYHRHGGTTSAANLGPACDRDHQLKTDGGFHLTQTQPGVFTWTTPTGHTYRVEPGTNSPYHQLPRTPHGAMREPPPF